MRTVYMATGDAVAVLRSSDGRWSTELAMTGMPTQCIATDVANPGVVYCGTFGQGLWLSEDGGRNWAPAGNGIPHSEVMSVAVSPAERGGTVWVGTEPSALFLSEDGGKSWIERPALKDIPSAPSWSFPPRPWTSHVRWIAPDPNDSERLFVGIELGGVMRSLDAGITWEDRKPGSQHDAHTLRTHRGAPGRVYEAAGGGYAESRDGGDTWIGLDEGLDRRYVWGLAADTADPDTIVVSAAPGPRQAHNPGAGEAGLYRRVQGGTWQEVWDGLPSPKGTRTYVLASADAEPHVFYAATREGDLYRSTDAGLSWERQEIGWPDGYRAPDVAGMVVAET